MEVKNLLRGFRDELNQVIKEHNMPTNKIVGISNLDKYKDYLKSIETVTKLGKTIIFTNGNSWYIPTLIKNLVKSLDANETLQCKFGVICSDMNSLKLCHENGIKDSFYVDIPELKVSSLEEVKEPEDYTRLVFVKTVLIHFALRFGYSVVYIDPDMAFLQPSLQYILDKTDENGIVLAGIKDGNMNTNIIGVKPTYENMKLFEVDINTFEANILNRKIYNRFCGSDEEFLIMKDEYDPEIINYLSLELFPPGNYVQDSNNIMMLHANGISGLNNKINFMKLHEGWFL
jgi:hypothetical protein